MNLIRISLQKCF